MTTNREKQLKTLGSRKFATTMMLPTLITMVIMTVYPMISTILYSFTNFRLLKKNTQFVGFQNYANLLSNEYFQSAILVTVKFTVLSVIFEMLLGFLFALYVDSLKSKKVQTVMRIFLLLPYLLPAVTVALSWRMMLSANYGIVNQWLTDLHLPVYNWFSDIHTAFGMLVVIDIWQNSPFVFLLLYASLQSVPKDQYKAAKMDGAGRLSTLWYITIPNLKTSLALCALLRTIDSFRIFDKVNLLTGGGPANSTTTITQYIYNYGIKSLKFGLGSAGALIMTVIVLVLSSLYIKNALKTKGI
ncbi:MAG: sugar ABC transporter permease [Lachnospiraceae bacterium]|nr:sugar ABC transporter permease [Lachnospiraceae bacterium]